MDAKQFIDSLPPGQRKTCSELTKLILGTNPGLAVAYKWNNLTFSYNDLGFGYTSMVASILVARNHVSVAFTEGTRLKDPGKMLEGSGKKMRHVKLLPGEAIPAGQIMAWVKETIALKGD